ncbi:metallophosphoesterase [uncultured Draconibacterium sp.]|uniref:metallophosphoesterase n=1 Tax=uncultured Draconibacterium sp. TaxID=1573823 RepID=UPI0025F23F1A|nr:metallophosphoesterase [uncultured Draconibacterium sp.]
MRASAMLLIPMLLFMLLVDIYTFRGIKPLLAKLRLRILKRVLSLLFWGISVAIFAGFCLFMFGIEHVKQADAYIYAGYLVVSFALFYIPKFVFIVFVLLKDIQLLFQTVINRIKGKRKRSFTPNNSGRKMERAEFLYQMGLVLAAIPFASILYGVTKGKFNYRVMRESLYFENLPKPFRGLKIVQLSDIHLGSFNKKYDQVAKAVELINEQKPDILLFTGDLVNNFAEETEGWAPVLYKLKATIGKYSVLGNHDYGDYSEWESPAAKEKNLAAIKQFHKKIGFRLLLNETETISINDEEIALIGVENWGKPPFPQHGDLQKAAEKAIGQPVKILMSHDPSHWDEEVIKSTDIDLTFAGHTHGMQFGIERAGIKWSPVQYKYPRWGGLYREKDQYLYVNRGFGYIGFPGRIGMPPEITVVELV